MMPDKLWYLILGLTLLAIAGVVLWLRSDLRRVTLTMGLWGALAGPLSELWYFSDYWRPPVLFGFLGTLVEDVLFGFGVAAVAVSLPKALLGIKIAKATFSKRLPWAIGLTVLGFLVILVLTTALGLNSIYSSYIFFTLIFLVIAWQRPDLIRVALFSGLIMTVLIYVIYAVENVFAITFLDKYVKFHQLALAVNLPGGVPTTELLWYFLGALAGSTLYEYTGGYQLKRLKAKAVRTPR